MHPERREGLRLEAEPIFLTGEPVEWHPCDDTVGRAICLEWSLRDIARWNLLFRNERMNGIALVTGESVIGVVSIRGPLANPFGIQQVDGADDQIALVRYLQSKSIALESTPEQTTLMHYRWHLNKVTRSSGAQVDVFVPSNGVDGSNFRRVDIETSNPVIAIDRDRRGAEKLDGRVESVELDFYRDYFNIRWCNSLGSGYTVRPGWLVHTGLMTQTLLGCADPFANLGTTVAKFFDQDLRMTLSLPPAPELQLVSASGDRLTFVGDPY